MTGLAVQAAGIGALALMLSSSVQYPDMLLPLILAGVGMGLVFAPISTAVLAGVAPQDQATASGTNPMLREVGIALSVAVLTAVFVGGGGELTPTG